jgi:2-polyprenyl-6-hydroxyphenyl methylase / 3-demethylubiquinone-9 3-methyltransferase
MSEPLAHPRSSTLDEAAVAHFARLAKDWWDPDGSFRPLHQLGPARLTYVRDQLKTHYKIENSGLTPLRGLEVLDLGCGGGLIAEPLARLGARVTGIDPAPEHIAVAKVHAQEQGLEIDYQACRAEDLRAATRSFDAVLCLEVLEHVPSVREFLGLCAPLVRPGGLMILSTINRTAKSFALAIIGAEYVLRWIPVGTHRWESFVTPSELASALAAAGLELRDARGLLYRPLRDDWVLGSDTGVNYLATAVRKGA